jgi:large repetitive protein
MIGMLTQRFLCLLRTAALTVPCLYIATLLAGCGGSSQPVSIALTSSASSVDATDSLTLTATVTNDKNSDGVTWTVSGGGALSNTTATSATYTAPARSASSLTATVTVTSVADTSKTGTVTITVPAAPSITTSTLPPAIVGTAFSETLAVSGGISPYTWKLSSGSLPSCITLTSAGVLSGTPIASCAGSYDVTFEVTDAGTPTALTATEKLTIVINAAPAIVLPAPATLLAGVYNVAYTGSVAATGGSGALTYSNIGSLPTGLSLNAGTGAITGTPTAGGAFNFSIKAADAFGDSATQAYSIAVTYPTLSITNTSLPAGLYNTAYGPANLAATGGSGSAANLSWSWAAATGSSLPTGLSLSSAGVLSGKPTATGNFSVVVTATDSVAKSTASATLSISITYPTLSITTSSLPNGVLNAAYPTTTLAATGGAGSSANYTWSWTAASGSSLPAGLALSSGGVLTGTPTAGGSFSVVLKVTDSVSNTSATATLGITVTYPSLSVTTATLPNGILNAVYSPVTLAATGGSDSSANYSWTWAAATGSSLPAGLSLSTTGVITGTPTAGGAFSVTVTVADSVTKTNASATLSLTVTYPALTITTTALPNGILNTAYSAYTLTATGGSDKTANYTWTWAAASGSSLPPGMSLSAAGVLTGTPTSGGSYNVVISVADSVSKTNASAPLSFTVGFTTLVISTKTLPAGNYNATYGPVTLAATGGSGNATNYTWTWAAAAGSSLPTGLSLSTGGVISGTPTATGPFSVVVTVADSISKTNTQGTLSLTVTYATLSVTTTALPNGVLNAVYAPLTLAATGGSNSSANYTWSWAAASGSSLPAGLVLSPAGVISGTPTAGGTFSVVITVADSVSKTNASATLPITITYPSLTITTKSIPNGLLNAVYTPVTLAATGGSGSVANYSWTWAAASGSSLPTGLTLSTAGIISGTPTAGGSFSVTITVADSVSKTNASVTLPVTINYPSLSITTTALPNGLLNSVYAPFTLAATGGSDKTANYGWTWAAASGSSLPTGLTLSSAGVISGTPTAGGSFSVVTTVADSVSKTNASVTLGLTVTFPALSITTAALPSGILNSAYSPLTLAATGGSGNSANYTWSWAAAPTSSLPAGMSVSAAGVLSGTPTTGGAFSVVLTVADSVSKTNASVTLPLTITYPVLSITNTSLPNGVVNTAYGPVTLAATGGSGSSANYTWSWAAATGSSLPTGLNLSAGGLLNGTPTALNTFSVVVTVADSVSKTSAQKTYTIVISNAVTVTSASPLPTGYVGVAYSDQLTAAGGAGAPYTFTVTSGSSSLATLGLTVSTSGLLTGATPVAGTASFTVQAKDGSGNTGSATLSVTINPTVTVTTTSPLPTGIVGTAYSDQLAATGGSGTPYTWTVTSGSSSLTAVGLTVSGTGLVSGATPIAGSASFTVQAKDSAGNTGTATLSITIDSKVTITTTSPLPTGIIGTAYSQTLVATGGTGSPYTWTVTSGSSSLTAVGLSLSGTGVLSGATPIAGSASFTVQAKDSAGNTGTATLSVTIDSKVTITTASPLPTGIVGTAYTQTLAASGGTGTPYTWTVTSGSSSLTAVGLSLSTTGVLSGATPIAGTASFTAQAKDSAGNTGSATFSLTIDSKVSITTTSPLPSGVVGTAYSQTFAAIGGTGTPYTWTVTSGSSSITAVGLSLSSTGVLSGATPIAGSASFTVQAKDSLGNTASASFSVTINASLTITTTTLPSATTNAAYSQQLASAGGSGGNVWSTTGTSNLGAFNLTLSASGLITGTPTTTGTATFTAQVKDSTGDIATQPLTIAVYSPLVLTPSSLPAGDTGVAYGANLFGSGGSANYCYTVPTAATVASGALHGLSMPLPNSLSCSGFTAPAGYGFYIGVSVPISGTPTTTTPPPYSIPLNTTLIDLTTGISVSRAYSISITAPPALSLPTPDPSSLPSATVNAFYSGSVTANGGAGTYTWTVNGSVLSSTIGLGNGNLGLSANGNSLTITGTPNTVTTAGSPISFTASVADSAGQSTGTNTYTIAVNNLATISGHISLNDYCGPTINMPAITLTINTSTPLTTTTDSSGNFSFPTVPNGSWTITPSISGPESVFYPASLPISVNSNPLTGENFSVALGYTVSGNITRSGAATGQTYVVLNSNNCGSGNGTSITESTLTSGGAYTIRGVEPGNYTLQAWMDTTGQGSQNAADPSGAASSNISVSTANVTGASVAMTTPTVPIPTSGPSLQNITPGNLGVAISFNAIKDNNGVEAVQSYTVQWSTSSSFTNPSSATFAATGTHSNVWLLNSSTPGITGSFTNGTAYYFRARGNVTAGSGPFSTWGTPTAVTIGAPSGAGYFTVSGTVTIPSSVTPTGPLFVGVYNQNTGAIFGTRIASPSSANAYSVSAPSDSNPDYFLFAILDQNNNGMIDVGDVTNTDNNSAGLAVTGNLTGQNITLPTASSTVSVTTQYTNPLNQNPQYVLSFNVREGNKLPVSVTLMSGPNVIHPIDMASCQGCGTPQWQYYTNISPVIPVFGQAYTFLVTYSDGNSETLTGTITGVLTSSDLATNLLPDSTRASTTPPFTWTDPASAGSYIYQFSIGPASGGNYIWQLPGNNSNLNGFSSSITSITWGTDPTGGGSTPTQSTLTAGTQYNWSIEVQDGNGNQATTSVQFTTSGTAPFTLPTPNPGSLGSALVGQSYNGSITATGGVPNYTWTVNGTAVNPSGCTLLSIGNGLSVCNSNGSSTLSVVGTPTSATTVSFTASVTDSTNATDTNGTLTYTINVNNASALTLPDPSTNTGSALVNYPYGASLQASGGTGSGYVFTLNSNPLPTNGTLVSIGDGLSAYSNGGNNFFVTGTPTSATAVTFTLSVKDSANDTDTGGTLTYSINVSALPSGANNANLTGRYVCDSGGFTDSDGTLWRSLSSFQANGSGGFTSGVFDTNGTDFPAAVTGTVTGTYSIGSDNNGIATLTSVPSSGPTVTSKWAIALTNTIEPAQEFRMVEIDDVGASPSGRQGQADCYLATTSAFTASTVSGHSFVFLANGETGTPSPVVVVGRISALSGNITGGVFDQAIGVPATVTHTTVTSGSYTLPTSPSFTTSGRYTLSTTTSQGTSNFVTYVVDSARAFFLQTDAANGSFGGNLRTQQQTSYSGANLNGNMVWYFQGFDASSGALSGYNSSVFQASGNGAGSITINESYQDDKGTYSVGSANGAYPVTFDPTYPGRVTFAPGSGTGYLYMYNNNAADFMAVDGNGDLYAGFVDPQTQTTFTDAALAGTYMLGGFPQLKPKDVSVGEVALSTTGAITASASTGGQNAFTWDDPQSGLSYSWLSTTYGSVAFNDNGTPNNTCIVISATKFVCSKNSSSTPGIMIFQK